MNNLRSQIKLITTYINDICLIILNTFIKHFPHLANFDTSDNIYFLTQRCSHGNSTCCFSCQTFKMAALTYTVRQWQQKRAAHTELFISAAQALPWHRTRFRWIKDPQGAVPALCSAASSMSGEKHTYKFTSWATGALAGPPVPGSVLPEMKVSA